MKNLYFPFMNPNSYCAFVATKSPEDIHRQYHDYEYGFPLQSDDELFGRLILEINQAGLSWATILNKKENFKKAYSNFSIKAIAEYDQKEINRLLKDAGIIRNKLKISVAVYNAQQIMQIQEEFGAFKNWLDQQKNLSKDQWVKLFKKTFKFTGDEITGEFLMSTGYLAGAHDPHCPVFNKIESLEN